jgi:hypothetical protein
MRYGGGLKPGQMDIQSAAHLLPDPLAFKAWANKLAQEWDFDNMCAAHQGNKIGGAKEQLVQMLKKLDEDTFFEKLAQDKDSKLKSVKQRPNVVDCTDEGDCG